jgi:activator of HSP90 ATPase
MSQPIGRRDLVILGGLALGSAGIAGRAQGASDGDRNLSATIAGEISHANAAIHQEVDFAAGPSLVYATLTGAERFDKVVQHSAAMNTAMKKVLGTAPTQIEPVVGGGFSLFGGYVTGRFLELVPDTRIVQAWRAGSWPPGAYSIAGFVLSASGAGTKLVFDHRGFPSEQADHLAEGWHRNYWEPLAKVLA